MNFINTEEAKVLKELYKKEYINKTSSKISYMLKKARDYYSNEVKKAKENFRHENNNIKDISKYIFEISEKLSNFLINHLVSNLYSNNKISYENLNMFVSKITLESFSFQVLKDNKKLNLSESKLELGDLLLSLEKYSNDASIEKIKDVINSYKQKFISERMKKIKKKTAPLLSFYKLHFTEYVNEYSILNYNNTENHESIDSLFNDNDRLLEVLLHIGEKFKQELLRLNSYKSSNINNEDLQIDNLLGRFNLKDDFDEKLDLSKYIRVLINNIFSK
jgi:hypothetical protein